MVRLLSAAAAALLCAATPLAAAAWQHVRSLPSSLPKRSFCSYRPTTSLHMADGGDANGIPVTILGGTGFVGSRVCKKLSERGASVTSVSKTGQIPEWCAGEGWTSDVTWNSADLLGPSLDGAVGRPVAVVSCVGVVGFDRDDLVKGNGYANVAGFESAARAGSLKTAVYVSVASEVAACEENWLPEFFGGYFEGKRMAERAALDAVGSDESSLTIVRPSFIYGGDAFGLFPPRVNGAYGSAVEELLNLPPFRFLADKTPGLIKVALRPPSSVDAVAEACARAAVGGVSGILDGTDAINEAAGQPDAKGLTEAIEWAGGKVSDAVDWAKVEVPKAIEMAKTKVDEVKSN